MQIHELNTFSGTPSSSDYLIIDNGTDTAKVPATAVGTDTKYPTATQAQITAGKSKTPSVVTPAIFNSATKAIVTQSYVEGLLEDGDSLLSASTITLWKVILGIS